MQSRIVVNSQEESLLSTHKVLRNTYFLLGLTMAFSAVVAYISMSLNLPYPNLIVLLVGFYGLLFVTNRLANSAWGILAAFAFTGFMGYTIGPILNMYVARGMEDLIMLAFAGTAIVFFACSAYVLTTKKEDVYKRQQYESAVENLCLFARFQQFLRARLFLRLEYFYICHY